MFRKVATALTASALALSMAFLPADAAENDLQKLWETESNNTPASANTILGSCIVSGSLQNDDVDYFIFSLSQKQDLSLTSLTTQHSAKIAILAGDGQTVLASSVDMGYSGTNQSFAKYLRVQLDPGNYYIMVSDSQQRNGSYAATLATPGLQRPDPIPDDPIKPINPSTPPASPFGWNTENGTWCYYEKDGTKRKNNWVTENDKSYYLGSDGSLVTNRWAQVNENWYYLTDNGTMAASRWVQDSAGWCYLGSSGQMLSSGWAQDSAGWCYMDSSGHLLTNGWAQDSIDWCYLDSSGHLLTNGWATDSHGWCYLDGSGHLLRDGYANDTVGQHYLDASGHMAW